MIADYLTRIFNIPRNLLDNKEINPILKYHSYFKDFKFYSQQGELIIGLGNRFAGIIQTIGREHLNDREILIKHLSKSRSGF
jgi:hypothetical protein